MNNDQQIVREAEDLLRLLAGPDSHTGRISTTTINRSPNMGGHPSLAVDLADPADRERVATIVCGDAKKPGYIGVLISRIEEETQWPQRTDNGRCFPHKHFVRTNQHIEIYQALWAELDEGTAEEQLERLKAFGVEPTMIVHSGGRSYHAYWVLAQPIDEQRFREVMRRLCAQLKADRRAIDPMRQLRMPGCLYEKSLDDKDLRRARLVFVKEHFSTIEEIEEAINVTEEEVQAYFKLTKRRKGRPPRKKKARKSEPSPRATTRPSKPAMAGLAPQAEQFLAGAYELFGPMRNGQRNDLILKLIRLCHSEGCPVNQTVTIVTTYTFRYAGDSKDVANNPEGVRREIAAVVENWFAKARQAAPPDASYASVSEFDQWYNDILRGLPEEWSAEQRAGFKRWFKGFTRLLMAIAHARGIKAFRSHGLHCKTDFERPPGIGRAGRAMAYQGKTYLITRDVLRLVRKAQKRRRVTEYDIMMPIVAPEAWNR